MSSTKAANLCAQHLGYFPKEGFRGERFHNQTEARIKSAMMFDLSIRVARHKQDLHLLTEGEQTCSNFASVHAWHEHIGHQQMDGVGVLLGNPHAGLSVMGL